MYPRSFDYVAPSSLDEALDALASNPGAKVMAGGQSLLPLMKMRLFSPETVVDIGKIPGLDAVEDRGDHLSIGALVRHQATATDATIATHAQALAEAASYTGDPQVRNVGTTCGSLAHADIAADQQNLSRRVAQAISEQGGRPDPGRFPIEFAAVNDLALDFLLQELVKYQQRDVAAIEGCVTDLATAPALRPLAEEALARAREHLDRLKGIMKAEL